MSAKGRLKPAVADHLLEVHGRNGTLDKVLNSGIGDDLRARMETDAFAFGAGVTAGTGSEPWVFDGTALRMVADVNPGPESSEVIAASWVEGRAFFIGFNGTVENLYAFDPVANTLSIELAALSTTARSSQIALSAGRFLVVTTADPGLTENRRLLVDTQSGESRDLLDGTRFETSPYTPILPAGELGGASYFAVNGQVDGVWSYQLLRLDAATGTVSQAVPELAFEQAGGVAGDRLFFGAREGGPDGTPVLYSLDAAGNLRSYDMPDGYLTGLGGDFVALGDAVYFRTAARYDSDIHRIGADGSITRVEDHAVMVGTAGSGLILLDLEGAETRYIRVAADGTRTDFAAMPEGEVVTLDHALVGTDLYYTTRNETDYGQTLYRLDTATGGLETLHSGDRIDIRAVLNGEVLISLQAGSDPIPQAPPAFFTVDPDADDFTDFVPIPAQEGLRFDWDLVPSNPEAVLV